MEFTFLIDKEANPLVADATMRAKKSIAEHIENNPDDLLPIFFCSGPSAKLA